VVSSSAAFQRMDGPPPVASRSNHDGLGVVFVVSGFRRGKKKKKTPKKRGKKFFSWGTSAKNLAGLSIAFAASFFLPARVRRTET